VALVDTAYMTCTAETKLLLQLLQWITDKTITAADFIDVE